MNDCVVVELKARESLHPNNQSQLLGCVRALHVPLGLLFNFHTALLLKGGYVRVVHPRYLTKE